MEHLIESKEQLAELWMGVYQSGRKPDWSHIIPYYSPDIFFKDSVQEIRGIEEFTAMTLRLAKRSGSLRMEIRNAVQNGRVIFIEWIMTLQYKRYPESSVFGSSRLTLDEGGKIIEQRDYYDLWGDIFDNIPVWRRIYRTFMHWKFG